MAPENEHIAIEVLMNTSNKESEEDQEEQLPWSHE